jgi:hypothetical protein
LIIHFFMSCILLISSCKFLNIYICLLSIVLFDISLAHLIMTYFFLSVLHYSSMLTMMLIGSVAQILLLSVSVCFLVMWLSLRNVKKKWLCLQVIYWDWVSCHVYCLLRDHLASWSSHIAWFFPGLTYIIACWQH